MKNHFPLFYTDTKKTKIEAVKTGMIFLDTNVLLHFFRLGESFSQTFFQMLEKVKDRVFIPYQVAKEYHPKYVELCVKLRKKYENAITDLTKLTDPFKQLEKLNSDYVRFIDKEFKKSVKDEFDLQVSKIRDKYVSSISFLKEELETGILFRKVGDFFSDKVLESLSDKEIEETHKNGKERYDKEIPPGYMDEKKGDNIYGDLIIWEEIIKCVASRPDVKYAIFVSDDVKEDWILKISGEQHGPRQELINEFNDRAHSRFFKMTVDTFIDAIQTAYKVVEEAEAKQAQEASSGFQKTQQIRTGDKIVRRNNNDKLQYGSEKSENLGGDKLTDFED